MFKARKFSTIATIACVQPGAALFLTSSTIGSLLILRAKNLEFLDPLFLQAGAAATAPPYSWRTATWNNTVSTQS